MIRHTLSVATVLLVSVSSVSAQERPDIAVALQSMGSQTHSLDSIENNGTAGRKFLNSIWEQLIALDLTDPDLPLMPGLATEWRYATPTVIEFKLREGVVFHNGDVMTADDVVFTFSDERFGLLPEQTAAREAGQSTYTRADGTTGIVPPAVVAARRSDALPSLERVEKVDDMTVRFILKNENLATERRLARLNYANISSKRAFYEAADWNDYVGNPVGAGPYKVERFDPGNEIVLVAHDEYYRGHPPIESLTFRVVPESASRVNGLLSGEYDIVSDVNPDQVRLVREAEGFAAVGGPVVNVRMIAFDVANESPLQNLKVRQALAHSIDYETIVKVLWSGQTKEAPGFQMPTFGEMFVEGYESPKFDPERAKTLLAEAGYGGEPINFYSFNDYYPNELTVGQYVLQTMQDIGFNINYEIKDGAHRKTPQRHMNMLSNTAHYAHPIAIMASNCPGGAYNLNNNPDGGRWQNDEFDKLCGTLNESTEASEIRTAMKRMMDIILVEDPAMLVLHQNAIIFGKSDKIEWQPSSIFAMPFGPGQFAKLAD